MSTRLNIRVTPRASKNAVDGFRDGALIVRVTAPPVDSAANEAVVALLADALGVAKRDIAITRGGTGRNKVVAIDGLSDAQIQSRLQK